jgi:hypothetical protein
VDHSVKQSAKHSRIIIFFSAHRSLSGLSSGHATEECLSCTKHIVHVVCPSLFTQQFWGSRKKESSAKDLAHKEVSVAASIVAMCKCTDRSLSKQILVTR